MSRWLCLGIGLAVFGGWACTGSPSNPSPVSLGMWGGDHVTMTVAATATHLEFDCAHGDIPGALATDSRNEFSVVGTFVREHGGPIRLDVPPDAHPAIYAGSVQSDRMALTIRLTDTGDLIGSFTLIRGIGGRIVKCL